MLKPWDRLRATGEARGLAPMEHFLDHYAAQLRVEIVYLGLGYLGCMYMYMYMCMYVYIYIYVYMYVYVFFMYIYVYTYTHSCLRSRLYVWVFEG